MKKTDLISSLAEHCDLAKYDAKKYTNIILQALTDNIASDVGVEIRGFGTFSKKQRKSRLGINPKTGEKVTIGEKFVPFFKSGKLLKETLNK